MYRNFIMDVKRDKGDVRLYLTALQCTYFCISFIKPNKSMNKSPQDIFTQTRSDLRTEMRRPTIFRFKYHPYR